MPVARSELTLRQRAVIERIERRVPIKMIAAELGVSPTRVNQHVREMKDLFGANSLGELVEHLRESQDQPVERCSPGVMQASPPCTKDALPKDQFSPQGATDRSTPRDDSAEIAFSDALSISAEAPWARQFEPAVVPGMLDGRNFVTARLFAMVGGALGIMFLLVLILTSLLSLGEMLEGRWYVPETNSALAVERGGMENSDVRSGQSGRVENQKVDARG